MKTIKKKETELTITEIADNLDAKNNSIKEEADKKLESTELEEKRVEAKAPTVEPKNDDLFGAGLDTVEQSIPKPTEQISEDKPAEMLLSPTTIDSNLSEEAKANLKAGMRAMLDQLPQDISFEDFILFQELPAS